MEVLIRCIFGPLSASAIEGRVMQENETLGMTYYRWLYWSMPESAY
jgi:hypothetical protein